MSDEKRRAEALRWLQTAQNDYEAAVILSANNKYSLSCFHAQQAAEKAIKALFYSIGEDPWGHSISKLLLLFTEKRTKFSKQLSALEDGAKRLDQFYIPTRYPNGIPDISPDQAYGKEDAKSGLKYAKRFLVVVKNIISGL
jgi:HEPN domain-containing protein